MLSSANLTNTTTPQQLLAQGNKAFRDGDYALAITYFEAAQQHMPAMAGVIATNIFRAATKLSAQLGPEVTLPLAGEILPEMANLPATSFSQPSCLLCLDSLNAGLVEGWALDSDLTGRPVVLQFAINGTPVAQVSTYVAREDVKQIHGGDGLSGFTATINRYACFANNALLTAIPVSHSVTPEQQAMAVKPWPSLFAGVHFKNIEASARQLAARYVVADTATANGSVSQSVIIVNHNQLLDLQACLLALLRYNSQANIIIVDQASTDGSVAFLNTVVHPRVTVLLQDVVLSYSESANFAASQASGDVLIFISPQVRLTEDTVSLVSHVVESQQFAVVGAAVANYVTDPQRGAIDLAQPFTELGVQFNGLARTQNIEPFALSPATFTQYRDGLLDVPAVSGAMLAISQDNFKAVQGFGVKANADYAAIALCLAVRQQQQKVGVLLAHQVGYVNTLNANATPLSPMLSNRYQSALQSSYGSWFRREFRQAQFTQPGLWNQKPLAIAMVVSEVALDTDKADFFTAKELGDALELEPNIVVGYFDVNSEYDVTGYDVVIVYIDSFDPRTLKNVAPHCVLIGWARNWFDSWCDKPWIEHYDMLYASSVFAQNYMQQRLQRQVGLLRIAAAAACLQPSEAHTAYSADYVFTGSYFKSPREITEALNPVLVPYSFKLFGHNWQDLPHFGQFSCGPVAYTEIPKIYASTRLVVDDANIATKKWGALNCRVYDALAAGVPCITNNILGVAELFADDFPTYDGQNLNDKLIALLGEPVKLAALAKKYSQLIRAEHTYPKRAEQLLADLKRYNEKKKVAIKIAAPDAETAATWGDFYFAVALRDAFERNGYAVRIDCLDQWYGARSLNDDTNLVLRGLSRFIPRSDQQNLLWLISHPDLVCEAELREYQHIFVASEHYAAKLQQFTGMDNIAVLLQASTFNKANLLAEQLAQTPWHDILFIGNSRNEYRDVVRWCVEAGLPVAVYGNGWEQFIPAHYIKGQFVPNHLLPYYYHNAGVVLNDHWSDMQRNGFVSNRVFDVICAGGVVLTNAMASSAFTHCSAYLTYTGKDEFVATIKAVLNGEGRQPGTLTQASYYHRATVLGDFL